MRLQKLSMSPMRPLMLKASLPRGLTQTFTHRGRSCRIANTRTFVSSHSCRNSSTSYLPMILQPQFWRTLWPKTRTSQPDGSVAPPKAKEWNPATFFIIIFLLIGSQSIQMIQLRRDFNQFSQQTEAKLSLLREVVRKFQNGEDVDVAKELGTGDAVKEKEWEEAMREIEEEDNLIQRMQEKRRKRKAAAEEKARRGDSGTNASK